MNRRSKRSFRQPRLVITAAVALGGAAGCNILLGLPDFKDDCPQVEEGKDCPDAGLCPPGTKIDCYTGPDGTEDVGVCHGGKRTCGNDGLYGPCEGDQKPEEEVCGNGQDDDCNGKVDDCPCTPGKTYACYTAKDQTTKDVGNCKSGTNVCQPDGTSRSPCEGEVQPTTEDYEKRGDENCDGLPSADTEWVDAFAAPGGVAEVTSVVATPDGSVYAAVAYLGAPLVVGTQSLATFGAGFSTALVKVDPKGSVASALSTANFAMLSLRADPSTGNVVGAGLAPDEAIVQEFDPGGSVVWTATCICATTSALQLGLLAIDDKGRATMGGALKSKTTCGTQVATPSGTHDVTVIHFDQHHAADWSKTYPDQFTSFTGIEAVASTGDIWVVGRMHGYQDLGRGLIGNDLNDDALAIVKFDVDGNVKVTKAFGTDERPLGMATDADGNLYVAFQNFGTISLESDELVASPGHNFALAAFDSAGGALWGAQYPAPPGSFSNPPIALALQPDGTLVVSSAVGGTVNFGLGNFLPDQATYAALVEFDPQTPPKPPKARWAKYYGGDKTSLQAIATSISVALAPRKGSSKLNDIVLGGAFSSPADFGTGTVSAEPGHSSAFLMRVAP